MLDDYTRLNTGDLIPTFRTRTTEGEEISIDKGTGKVILIHFFILGCSHCRRSLDHLELYQEGIHDHPGFLMLSAGRGHTPEDIREYLAKENSPINMVPDPDRKIYDLFADKKVPRFYLFDKDGKLVQQVRGFDDTAIHDIFKNISVLLDA